MGGAPLSGLAKSIYYSLSSMGILWTHKVVSSQLAEYCIGIAEVIAHCRNVRVLGRVSYIVQIENLNISTEMLLNEKLPSQVWEFSAEKLFKWEPCKSCKIPYKLFKFCGLSTQSIQTLYFGWYLKSYHFAIFLFQILLFLLKTLKFSWSFIWIS